MLELMNGATIERIYLKRSRCSRHLDGTVLASYPNRETRTDWVVWTVGSYEGAKLECSNGVYFHISPGDSTQQMAKMAEAAEKMYSVRI